MNTIITLATMIEPTPAQRVARAFADYLQRQTFTAPELVALSARERRRLRQLIVRTLG